MRVRSTFSSAAVVALAALVGLAAPVSAGTVPAGPPARVSVEVNGRVHQIPLVAVENTDRLDVVPWHWVSEEGDEVWIDYGRLDPDPSIAYGVSVIDFGAPSNFNFTFSTPIVPTSAPTSVNASIAAGLTDSAGSANGVSITPTLADMDGDGIAEIQIAEVNGPTNLGVDVGPAASYPLLPPPVPGANYVYQDSAGPQAGPGPGPYTTLSINLAFQLSGGGDIAALTGFAEINTVPEPSTMTLGGLVAVGVLAALVNRRRRGQR